MKNLHHLRYGRDTHIFHTVVDGGDFRCTAGSKYGVVVSGYLKIFRDSQLSFQCIFYGTCGEFIICGKYTVKRNSFCVKLL